MRKLLKKRKTHHFVTVKLTEAERDIVVDALRVTVAICPPEVYDQPRAADVLASALRKLERAG